MRIIYIKSESMFLVFRSYLYTHQDGGAHTTIYTEIATII